MANLSLRHVYKVYPNGVKAVNDFSMDIKDNEFIVFVGPSGCGKSTTLRMIAGLEDISAGEIYIGNEIVNDIEPKDRDISMVFQNYALYPHMTVYDNMAFGLKLRHIDPVEIHQKVLWAADALKLTEYLDRKPKAMSGGQRQRVALGRAILRNPKVFLLDEPLSNLDAKLRTEMRAEIAKLHNRLNTTFIYVTHDQVEAMTLGTRVVVMKLGYIQQIDTPQNLYNFPKNKFVAGFIGTPQMNFLNVTLKRNKETVKIKLTDCDAELTVPFESLIKINPSYLNGKKDVCLGLRCENLSIKREDIAKTSNVVKMKISHFEELGNETLIYGNLDTHSDDFSESKTNVIVKAYQGAAANLKPDDIIDVAIELGKAQFFDNETEETICPRIPEQNIFDCKVKDGVLSFLNVNIKLPKALKVENAKEAEFYVPTDAISLDGDIEAVVENVEEINETKIAHLRIEERTFFVLNKDVKVGDKVHIAIDMKKISIKVNEVEVAKPLQVHNSFVASFTNYENTAKSIKTICSLRKEQVNQRIRSLNDERNLELSKIGLNNELIKQAKLDYAKQVNDIKAELSYRLGTEELNKSGKKALKTEYHVKLETLKAQHTQDIIDLNAKKSSKNDPATLAAATEINAKYDALVKEELEVNTAYANCLQAGAAAHKEIAVKDLSEANSGLTGEIAAINAKKDEAMKELLASPEYAAANDRAKFKMHDELKVKYENIKDEAISTSKCFYFSINGVYVKSPLEINKKIIQALGIAIFTSNFRVHLGTSSLLVADEKDGFAAKVIDHLEYGKDEKYIVCQSFNETFIVKVDEFTEVGTVINLGFKLDDIEVYENKFDIRLY